MKEYKVGQKLLIESEITKIDRERVQIYPFVQGVDWTTVERLRSFDKTDDLRTPTEQQIQQLQSELERIQQQLNALMKAAS